MFEELKRYTQWFGKWVVITVLVMSAVNHSPLFRDDSDPGHWGQRSGMMPRTDHLTGCQYLQASNGGLTPRLGKEGQHVGCR